MTLLTSFDGELSLPALSTAFTAKYHVPGDSAIVRYRDIMGATDPAKAAAGTIRKVHAKSIGENSVHGSDAPDTAVKEIAQFFSGNEIVG